jgi:hypothetical protein
LSARPRPQVAATDRQLLDAPADTVVEIAEEPLRNSAGQTRYLTTRKVALRDDAALPPTCSAFPSISPNASRRAKR